MDKRSNKRYSKKIKVDRISLSCNYQAAKTVINNKLFNRKKRGIMLKQVYINSLVGQGIIFIINVRSINNVTDIFTKGLGKYLILKTYAQMD